LSARRIVRCGGGYPAFAGVPLPSFISLSLGFGETGVANKETEAPPLSFHLLPGLRASRGRVLQRSGEEARRENDGCLRFAIFDVVMPRESGASSSHERRQLFHVARDYWDHPPARTMTMRLVAARCVPRRGMIFMPPQQREEIGR